MIQTVIALIIIALFVSRLIWQKTQRNIALDHFIFWLCFWLVSACLILFIKNIDRLVAYLGFSGSGIQILLYLAVALLFSQIFRLRLRLEKMEKNLTDYAEHHAKQEFNKRYPL